MATTEFLIISIVPSKGELKNIRPITSKKIMKAIIRTQNADAIWIISARRLTDKILIWLSLLFIIILELFNSDLISS